MSSSSPISPAVDHLADLALWEAELAAGPAADGVAGDPLRVASPLLDRLGQVPDPRRLRGLRHRLVVILVLTACATLVVGNDSVAAIRQWAAGTPQDVLHRIGARFNPLSGRYTVPSERTFRRVLSGLDGDALDTATLQAAQRLLSGTDTEFADHMSTEQDRGHGRTERRTLRVADCDDTLFPGARQVFRLRRDTGGLDGTRTSKDIIYGIVSLSADLAGPGHLNHYARGH